MSQNIMEYINQVPDGDTRRALHALVGGLIRDQAVLRTQFIALLAKLDADTGVNDTNYAATLTPAALRLSVPE